MHKRFSFFGGYKATFVGAENFSDVIDDRKFKKSLWITVRFTLESVALAMVAGLLIALVLNRKMRFAGLVRTIVILPWCISLYGTGVIFSYLAKGQTGIGTAIAYALGIEEAVNVVNRQWVIEVLAVGNAWNMAPLVAFFLLANLKTIPSRLYDLAAIDRMSRVETFLNVTSAAASFYAVRLHLHHDRAVDEALRLHLRALRRRAGHGIGDAHLPHLQGELQRPRPWLRRGHVVHAACLDPGHDTAALRRLGATGGEVDMRIRLSTIWSWLALAIVLIWTLLPLYWFLKNSLLTPDEIARFPPPLYPLDPTPAAFFNIFGFEYEMANGIVRRGSGQANQIIRGLGNSLIVSAVVTLVTLFVVLPLAYVFARLEFPHKNKLLFAILLAVALPPVSTLIPFYAMYVRLGLSGTLIGLIIVTLTITIPFVTWMLIGYFRNLPAVERLARIDGFSRFETFVKIIVPLGRSGVAVAAVIAFLFSWNEYTYALFLVNGTTANTLPTAISGFLFQHPEASHLAAAVLLTMVPPALVAFFLQRHIAEMNLVDPVR